MGNFGGHALPGSFFILFSLWWTICIFQRYYRARYRGGQVYISTMTFPCNCLCGRLRNYEVEGFVKILFTSIGFTLEIITGFVDGKFVWLGNGQHATMFFFFGMSGVVDIMVHHHVPLPKGIEYIVMALALIVEGVLFNFHLGGRGDLDILIHTLLIYAVFAGVLAIMMELFYRKHVLAALSRAYLVLVQGTWFWQVGFILYNPLPNPSLWEQDNHDHILIATMMFAWHIGVDFVIMIAIGILIGRYHRQHGSQDALECAGLNMQLLKKDANGHVGLENDSGSDVEFERLTTQH
jgi:hypothetical protein